jgi:hypothetical protein
LALQEYFKKPLRLTIKQGENQLETPALVEQQEKAKQKSYWIRLSEFVIKYRLCGYE